MRRGPTDHGYCSPLSKKSITGRSYASSCSPVDEGRLNPDHGRSLFNSTAAGFGKHFATITVEARRGSFRSPDNRRTRLFARARAKSQEVVPLNLPNE